MNKETTPANRYQELDALRGIAALLVVLFHFALCADKYDSVLILGTTGIDLFFMISGFVIFMSMEKITSAKQFITNRFSRLYPTYWTAVSFTFVLLILEYIFKRSTHQPDVVKYLANMTMFQYYFEIPDIDGPYWTMIIEMLFYIVILLLYQLRGLKYAIHIFTVLSVLTAILCNYFYDNVFVKELMHWFPLLPHLPLFLAGMIFYKIYSSQTKLIYHYTLLLICLLCGLALFKHAGRSNYYVSLAQYQIILPVFFMLFVLFVHGKLTFIVNGVTLFFGKISYPLYLTHQHISIMLILPVFMKDYGMNFWIAALLIDLPVVICIAAFITYGIEIPFHKKLKKQFSQIQKV